MRHFEEIHEALTELFTVEFEGVCREVNARHNDGTIITPLNRPETKLRPYFEIGFESAEKTEKDILIENDVYAVRVTLHLNGLDRDCQTKLWRYFEAVDGLLAEESNIKITGVDGNSVKLRVVL